VWEVLYDVQKTILSGSSDQYHVFYNEDLDHTAILDGVIIADGNANVNSGNNRYGGGMVLLEI